MSRKIKTEIKVSTLFKKNHESKSQIVVNVGGARSGKSYAIAQLLIMYAAQTSGLNIAITRKTMPALKMTAYRLVTDLLKKYRLYRPANHNKSENYYDLKGSRIQFFSLDDPEKIKSAEFNYIWMEEANEFNYQDYIVLLTRLSAPVITYPNKMFLTLNPSDSNCWIAKKLLPQKGVQLIKSTYKDNPFLSKDYIGTLLSLKDYDKNAYNVFALGNWGSNERAIYPDLNLVESPPSSYDEVIWGLDFGFNNPSALVKIYIKDNTYTAQEALYCTGLTNSALIDALQEIIPPQQRSQPIYGDAAEPDRIAEISRAGFNIYPALKTVNAGIMAVKAAKPAITKSSVNLIKEMQSYAWKCDISGNVMEEPVKFNDHILDALRYAIYTHITKLQQSTPPDLSFI